MNTLDLSFVIPTYNADKTIKICVDSIKSSMALSPHISYEIIVVDNNSTDETADIISKLEVTVIVEKKQGRSFARNSGLFRSKGRHVAFIDADVYIQPKWAESLLLLFSKNNVAGVQGKIIPCRTYGSKSLNEYRFWAIGSDTNETFCLPRIKASESPMINSAACLYLREALLQVGGFEVKLERHEDIDLAKRVFLAGFNLASSEKAVAMVIFHGNGWWDYFKRSFADGFFKYKYTYRWADFYKVDKTPKNSLKFFQQTNYYLQKAFEEENFFWFVKIILLVFNCFGRLTGNIWYRLLSKEINELKTFKRYQESKLQYIFFDNGHYQIDLNSNELTDYTLQQTQG